VNGIESLNLWELRILDWIGAHLACPALDAVMPVISRLGDGGWFFILAGLLLLIQKTTRRQGFICLIALLMDALLVNLTLKPVVSRLRPYAYYPGMPLLVPPLSDFSFPSGHTAAAFAFAVSLFWRQRIAAYWALALGSAVGFSRLYLYMHYPSDVLFGVLFGVFCGWLALKLGDYLDRHNWRLNCSGNQHKGD